MDNGTIQKYERCIRQNEFKARDRSKFSADYFEMVWKSRRQEFREDDTTEKASKLIGSIVETLDIIAPMKNFKVSKKWYTGEVEEVMKTRDSKRAIVSNKEEDWEQYRLHRNRGDDYNDYND